MPNHAAPLDQVFHALADPTRRAVVERLTRGPSATKDLARPFRMALPSFTQHLDVLERSGLVRSTKAGRVRTYELVPKRLTAAQTWLERQRSTWERRLDQLDAHLMEMKEQQRSPERTRTPSTRSWTSCSSAWSTSRPSSCGARGPSPST